MRDAQTIISNVDEKKQLTAINKFHRLLQTNTAAVPVLALIIAASSNALLPTKANAADIEAQAQAQAQEITADSFADKLANAFKDGTILFDSRLRYEFADQDFIPGEPDPVSYTHLTLPTTPYV